MELLLVRPTTVRRGGGAGSVSSRKASCNSLRSAVSARTGSGLLVSAPVDSNPGVVGLCGGDRADPLRLSGRLIISLKLVFRRDRLDSPFLVECPFDCRMSFSDGPVDVLH